MKLFYLLIIICTSLVCVGQELDSIDMLNLSSNLVPNAGFEHSIGCPTMDAQITRARGWSSPTTASPDYCNTCGWPHTQPWWDKSPFQGNGYAYAGSTEYVQIRLSSPLINGEKYFCSIAVSGGVDIGLLFTAEKIKRKTNYQIHDFVPQIQNHPDSIFRDKEWHLVQGSFIAKGGEEYLTIGGFRKTFSKIQLSVIKNVEIPPGAGFIDNVSTKLVVRRKPLKVIQSELSRVQNIKFENRSFELDSSSFDEIKKVIKILERNKEISIKIIGHTDNNGSTASNKTLSIQRCRSVKQYLVKNGISKERIKIEGKGDSTPLLPNSSEGNRTINRRVEFKVI
jgi:outer membrane protein OmpA-like peptidoglycan-associated protein